MTNKYPDGKLSPDDEGSCNVAIGSEHGCVKIVFSKPTAWIGLPPSDARRLALSILVHASYAERAEPETAPTDTVLQ